MYKASRGEASSASRGIAHGPFKLINNRSNPTAATMKNEE